MSQQEWMIEFGHLDSVYNAARNNLTMSLQHEREGFIFIFNIFGSAMIAKKENKKIKGKRDLMYRCLRECKAKLKNLSNGLQLLQESLQNCAKDPNSARITTGELERRRRDLNSLCNNYNKLCNELQDHYNNPTKKHANYQSTHNNNNNNNISIDNNPHLTNQELQKMHEMKMQEQNDELEQLFQGFFFVFFFCTLFLHFVACVFSFLFFLLRICDFRNCQTFWVFVF